MDWFFRVMAIFIEYPLLAAAIGLFGTHDSALVSRIAERAKALGVGKNKYEIHML